MDADEHERKYMNLDGPVRFRDGPRRRRLLTDVGATALLLAASIAFALGFPVVACMALLGVVGLGLSLTKPGYRIVLTDRSLHLQYGLRTQRIPLSAVEDVTVASAVVTAAVVGRGPFSSSFGAPVPSHRAAESNGTVRVRWRQGARIKTTIVGTDRASELADILTSVRGRITPLAPSEPGARIDVRRGAPGRRLRLSERGRELRSRGSGC